MFHDESTFPCKQVHQGIPHLADKSNKVGISSVIIPILVFTTVIHSPNQQHVSASVRSPVGSQQLSSVREYNSDIVQHIYVFILMKTYKKGVIMMFAQKETQLSQATQHHQILLFPLQMLLLLCSLS